MKAVARKFFALTLALFAANTASTAPLGTGFTYQGQLNQAGSPVNGVAHLRFSLWDDAGSGQPPVGGTQVGASQLLAVAVANGLFTVLLNGGGEFSSNAFNGDARWLQIEVCDDGACGAPTVLSPRQAVSATPYALNSAGPWQRIGGALSYSGGNVGIGTSSPAEELHVVGDILCDRLTWNGTTSALDNDQGGAIELGNSLGLGNSPYIDFHRGIGAPEDYSVRLQNDEDQRLSVVGNLNVTGNVTREFSAGTANRATPIAYATINSDGTVAAGTPNVSSVWEAVNQRYSITITGEAYSTTSHVTTVTPILGAAPEALFATTGAGGGQLRIRVMSSSTGTDGLQKPFQFVTYKP